MTFTAAMLQQPLPLISIIIPAYNAERYLAETVASVCAQSLQEWELIIVDDGSSDNSRSVAQALAEQDERITVITQGNAGVSASRNHGYAVSNADSLYVIFLDADDVWEPDALHCLLTRLKDQPQAIAAHGSARYIDSEGVFIFPGEVEDYIRKRYAVCDRRVQAWSKNQPTVFAVEAVMNYIVTPGVLLIRRSALKEAGLFDPSLKIGEDWELWLRLCQQGEIAFVDKPILRYRKHTESATGDAKALARGMRSIWQRFLSSPCYTLEQRQMLCVGYRYYQRYISSTRLSWARNSLTQGQWLNAAKQLRHAALEYFASYRLPA